MIENRPASLLADPAHGVLPKLPLALDWSSVPELIRVATLCKCDHEIGTPVQHPLIPDRGGGAVPLPLRFTPASFC